MSRLFIVLSFFIISFQLASSQEIFWASKIVDCSDNYSASSPYGPIQILGKYNVMPYFGKSNCSYSIQANYKRNSFIVLEFDTIIKPKQLVLCENYNPGAVSRITLLSKDNKQNIIFENVNPQSIATSGRFWILTNSIDKFPLFRIKIEFNTANFFDLYQIDAVGITSDTKKIEEKINLSKEAEFKFQPENLKGINSNFSELAPIISSDGKTLYFTRGGHPDNLGAEKQQDLWYAVSSNGVDFGTPINIGSPINNSSNNFAISVTPDNNTLLLGNVFPKNQPPSTGLSLSRRTETGWSYPEALLIPQMNSKSKQNSYSLGNDGKTLLLSIYRDDSYGDNDLYVSFLTENNTWTPPKNLGAKINTAGNEISPFLASDGRTLYFSSNGYPGYGKNDLFLIRRIDDTWQNWSEPINLGNKINSIYWDAYFSVTASGDYAYFVSSTQASFSEDIYRIALPKAVQPTSVVLISGKVFNKQTKSPASATIIYEELPSGKQIGVAHSNPATGEYKITLPAGKNYGFLAQAQGFIAINENLNLLKQKEYQEIKRDLYLVPIEKGESVKLNNIFFESAKFEILPESFPELNRIVLMMNENPRLKIRIEGHTDNVGNDLTNKILSENRAKSIADYLISKGIAGNRFSHKGYGKKKPVAKNSTEEGRRMNRRVEFIILEK